MGPASGHSSPAPCPATNKRRPGSANMGGACTALAGKARNPPRALRPSAVSNSFGLAPGEESEHAAEERRIAGTPLFLPRQRRHGFGVSRSVRSRQRQRGLVLVRVGHHVVPQKRRKRSARDLLHPPAVVVADPHPADILRGIADEPGIAKTLRRSGLAGRLVT